MFGLVKLYSFKFKTLLQDFVLELASNWVRGSTFDNPEPWNKYCIETSFGTY